MKGGESYHLSLSEVFQSPDILSHSKGKGHSWYPDAEGLWIQAASSWLSPILTARSAQPTSTVPRRRSLTTPSHKSSLTVTTPLPNPSTELSDAQHPHPEAAAQLKVCIPVREVMSNSHLLLKDTGMNQKEQTAFMK